jgi:glutathione S-transferase
MTDISAAAEAFSKTSQWRRGMLGANREHVMTIRLHGSWFSPFARKVALALELKGLAYEPVDALDRDAHAALQRLNPRAEVPVLQDGDLVVVNSSDIIQYLDWKYPDTPLYPAAIADRVTARALERLADGRVDALMTDCSFWRWAERDDAAPEGLMEAGQRDLDVALAELEAVLVRAAPWPFGAPGLVECAWFPHLAALRWMGFRLDARFAATQAWIAAMRAHPVFEADLRRTAAFVKDLANRNHERRKLFWRGDRIEWLFSRGFHKWFAQEIEAGRTVFPS